jgi:hemerythrin-like domain-containing protein
MTRAEIEHESLGLPEAERAALVETLVTSLQDSERLAGIRARLDRIEAAEMEALRRKLDAEMDSWFEGPSVEVTDEVWEEILVEARSEERLDEPFGEGVPEEWVGRTPRELRESLSKG